MNVQSSLIGNAAVVAKDKRTTIFQAALELIAERGFHGAPMSLVAQRAGVSAGIIYHYFASKEELIHELYRYVEADFSRALLVGSPQSLPLAEAFTQVWLNAYRFYHSNLHAARFLEQYKHSPFHQATGMPDELLADSDFAFIAQLFAADPADRPIKDFPFNVIYELTLGVAARVAYHDSANEHALDDQLLEQIAAACWRAIAR